MPVGFGKLQRKKNDAEPRPLTSHKEPERQEKSPLTLRNPRK